MISIKEVSGKHKAKLFSTLITLAVIVLLFLAGPAQAITLGITDISDSTPNEDTDVYFLSKIDIHTNDRIPLTNVTVYIEYSNGTSVPGANLTFDLGANNKSSHSSSLAVKVVNTQTNYSASKAGYGYGYGYDSTSGTYTEINESFSYGYAAASGYGYDAFDSSIKTGSGATTAEFIYNITWETPSVDSDTAYKVKMYVTAADDSNSAKYYLKTAETLTVQNVAETPSSPSGGSSSESYDPTENEIAEGYTETLREDDVINFNIGGSSHSLKVEEIYSDSVKIEVESTPQTAILTVGETKKFELTGDNYYDLKVTLESLSLSSANLNVQSISELISGEESSEEGTTEDTTEETGEEAGGAEGTGETTTPEEESSNLIWWIIGILLIIIIAGSVVLKKKSNQ